MLNKIYVYCLAVLGNMIFSIYWFFTRTLNKYKIERTDNPKVEKYLYYASKPLQYINLRNTNINKENYNILIIDDCFIGASDFVDRIKLYDQDIWSEIYLLQTSYHIDVNFAIFFSNLKEFHTSFSHGWEFIGGLSKLYLNGCKIYDYEEGIGNYRNNMLCNRKKGHFSILGTILYKIFGIKDYLDSSPFLSGVYLYFPKFNRLRIPESKRLSFNKLFKDNMLHFKKLFNISKELQEIIETSINKTFLIIATDWSGEYNYSDEDLEEYDYIMVKFHPHIKKIPPKKDNKLFYIEGNFCIELLCFSLSGKNKVTFRSNMSSASIYLIGNKNITIENIGNVENIKFKNFYNELYTHIENLSVERKTK